MMVNVWHRLIDALQDDAEFFLIFVGKNCQEKSSGRIPGKVLQNLHNPQETNPLVQKILRRVSFSQNEKLWR